MNNNINNANKEEKEHGKYYVVKSKNLSKILEWITGQRPYVFFDRDNKTEKVKIYSFLYNKDIRRALDILHDARKELYKEHK